MESPEVDSGPAAGALDVAVLGTPVVRSGGRVVAFRSRKEFALLAYLALTRLPQPREHLAALFWPDHDERAARNSLRTTLSRLRHDLAVAGGARVAPLLRAERDALGREVVALAPASSPIVALDSDLLEAAAAEETADGAEGAGEAPLQAAVAAYRGPFLEGVRLDDAPELEAWVDAQRAYWQERVERVLGRLATVQLGRRALAKAAATARHWLALDALSEPAYRALMRALADSGDRAGALAVYEECRRVLRDQLAVDPSPETVALAERLRRLPAAARSADPPPAASAGRVSPAGGLDPAPAVELPFVGREQEFAVLAAAYQAARAGRLQVVILEGEAGSGKTRLIEEFLRWATLEGADVLHSRGDETRGTVPYQLLVDAVRPRLAREHAPEDLVADVWLTELVRLFPELRERYPDLPPAATLAGDAEAGPVRLFEAAAQLLLALAERARPGALVLCYDDVQWSDQAMRDLLLYRLRRHGEAGAPQLLLLVVQAEALARAPELAHWLRRLTHLAPATRLRLGPLAEAETVQALTALLADPDAARAQGEPTLGSWLHAQAEGQPLYLVELLRALVEHGILVPVRQVQGRGGAPGTEQGPRLALAPGVTYLPRLVPAGVHNLIRGQLDGLSAPALEMLAAAAVLGSDATFEHLCRMAEVDERTGLAALDELSHRGLLVETGAPASEQAEATGLAAYRFAHDLVREVVYTEAGEARRRLFHRRALALLKGSGAVPADLARHAQAAGLTAPAVQALVAAGDAALAVFATGDARAHYEQARRLLAGPEGVGPPRRQDWREAPAAPVLQNRTRELATLAGWVGQERCRVVQVLGAGGVGKTALAARLAHDVAAEFEVVSWCSLRNAPPPQEWLAGVIAALSAGQTVAPESLEAQLQLLLGLLRARRGLLVLDNLEAVLEPGTPAVRYRAGYECYGEALAQLGASEHQGCLLLTSREQPLREAEPAVRALHLAGLSVADGRALLGRRLAGDAAAWAALVGRYGGNPLALQMVGETIAAVFGGDIGAFLAQEASVFGGIRQLLDEQMMRLSPLEQTVLRWLAVEREPVAFGTLVADLGAGAPRAEVVEALQALRRRSLLEPGGQGTVTLQPVVLEHATAQLVARMGQEVLGSEPELLVSHALLMAQSKDYVRRSQERLIAQPVLDNLVSRSGGAAAAQRRLLDLLDAWRGRPAEEQGYGPGNVLNLVRLLRGDLRELDLSHLAIRQAYLAEVEAQDASLAGAHLSEAVLAEAFAFPVSVALSTDGTYLAAGTTTGQVRLWRVADRTPLLALQGHAGMVRALALSGDGALLASGSFDGMIELWQAPSGRLVAALQGHSGAVGALALSGDGALLASGSEDGTVKLWEAPTGQLRMTLHGHSGGILGVALSRDGQMVASGSIDGTVRLWGTASGQPRVTLQGHSGAVWAVALSGDGQVVASGGLDGTVRLWETASGRLLATLQGHNGGIWAVAFSGDGQMVASGGQDRTVRLWAAPSGRLLATVHGHSGTVWSVALSGDGALLASGSQDGAVKLWETASGQSLATLHGHSDAVGGVALSGDGQVVASGSLDGTVRLWETASGRLLATLQGHSDAVYGVALSGDGALLASGSFDGTIRLWAAPTGQPLATLPMHSGGIWAVALSGDGRLLASGNFDGTVTLWTMPSGRPLATLAGHSGLIHSVALSGDGQVVASGSDDGTVRLWAVPSGRLLATLHGHSGGVWSVALSGDGQVVASGGFDGTVRLWETASGRLLATLQGHSGLIYGVALSGDGQVVASGSQDGAITLWAAPSGRPLATLHGHSGVVYGVAFSGDGRLLASSSDDGTVRLWEARNGASLRTLQAERRYERLDITGLSGVTEAQRAALMALGAVERHS